MIDFIKKIIPMNIKMVLKKEFFKLNFTKQINNIHLKYKECILFIAVPTHGNLGDHAIVYSQYKMFNSIGITDNILEIKNEDYLLYSDFIQTKVKNSDTIVIDGGGNMGTLWFHEELKMRDIVNRFKNNKIIIFPETVYYSDDDFGKKEFQKSKEVYNNHRNLHICVRDKRSYELIKDEYNVANIKYVPDIVLYLNIKDFGEVRKDVLLCLREDKEKITDNQMMEHIKKYINQKDLDIKYTSTVIDKTIRKKDREKELYKKWKEFSSAKIVITDRLHGMIFSAITGTRCIALNNSNGKVKGVYEWIKQLPYIVFCEDINNLSVDIDNLINLDNEVYNNDFLLDAFHPIKEMIEK